MSWIFSLYHTNLILCTDIMYLLHKQPTIPLFCLLHGCRHVFFCLIAFLYYIHLYKLYSSLTVLLLFSICDKPCWWWWILPPLLVCFPVPTTFLLNSSTVEMTLQWCLAFLRLCLATPAHAILFPFSSLSPVPMGFLT